MEFKLTPELKDQIDKFTPSPDVMALRVSQHLMSMEPKVTNNEIIAYCVAYLMANMNLFGAVHNELATFCKHYYVLHYVNAQEDMSQANKPFIHIL